MADFAFSPPYQKARDKLASALNADSQQYDKTRLSNGVQAADQEQATKNAYRSGEYDRKGNYNPFEPARIFND